MSAQKAKIVAVNGNGTGPQLSDPDDFPVPLEGVIVVELNTGRKIEMVIGELEMLYELGEVPNELTRIAARELMVQSPTNNEAEREKRYKERWRIVEWLVNRVLVRPKNSRLYNDEKWQIYNMANSPALALDNFRRQQARHVGVVPPVQDLGASAEPTPDMEAVAE